MPWGKRREGDKVCVYKKDGGKILHCYSGSGADGKADKYLAALYASEGKELDDISNGMYLLKEADGRYLITTVSTAAIKDREDETFDVEAIDWDIKEAERTGNYPEFRLFHKKALPIGKVEKMQRVGIFAVDQGHSYTDPFSIEVCEKMLSNNNGKWRCSRGFYVHEVSGKCPKCGTGMVITKEHMMVGFKCPHCKSVHMGYKGVLKEVHFQKARTFDVTITDIPCVPYTGVSARKEDFAEAKEMLKSQLKQRLLDAGVKEDVVDAQLEKFTDAQLKEVNDIPEAVLKELDLEVVEEEADDDVPEAKEDAADEEDQTFTLDPSVLTAFTNIVKKEVSLAVKQQLDGLEISIDAGEEKEYSDIEVLKDQVAALTAAVEKLTGIVTSTDKERLKEVLADAPRNGKLRVVRFKSKASEEDDPDEEEPDDDEDDMPMSPRERMMKKKQATVVISDAEGHNFGTMTEFVTKSN